MGGVGTKHTTEWTGRNPSGMQLQLDEVINSQLNGSLQKLAFVLCLHHTLSIVKIPSKAGHTLRQRINVQAMFQHDETVWPCVVALLFSVKQLVWLARPSHLNAGGTEGLAIGWDGLAS